MIIRYCLLPLAFLFLVSCSSFDEIPILDKVTEPDYVNSKKSKKLEIPPDLSEINANGDYTFDGKPTTYKNYSAKEKNKNEQNLIKKDGQVRVIKSGNMRWLVVSAEFEPTWLAVESFWEDMGFAISKESKLTGILETEWISEKDLNKDDSAVGRFDAWLDQLANTATKRKFRTRIEHGSEPNTVEVYLSQRTLLKGLEQHNEALERHFETTYDPNNRWKIPEYKDDDKEKSSTEMKNTSNFKEDDLEIQIELLRRLMVKLGTSDLTATNKINDAKEITQAKMIDDQGYKYILLSDPYQRSWRRLSLAIDMVGFQVVDKNRSNGIFYIKYSNLEIDENKTQKKKGLIDKLAFWKDDEIEQEDKEGQEKYKSELEGNEEEKELTKKDKTWSEKTWEEKIPFLSNWGDDDEKGLEKDEKRFRVRISEVENGTKVFIDYPDKTINKTKTAQSVINILYDYLK